MLEVRIEVGQGRHEALAAMGQSIFELLTVVRGLDRFARVGKAELHDLDLPVVELLGLGEHRLPHANLAEIVEESRVADFGQLSLIEVHVLPLADANVGDGSGDGRGYLAYPEGMTGGGGVAGLDRKSVV